MKIRIICVGKIKDRNLLALISEYEAKINYDAKLDVIEIKDSSPVAEGRKILELLNNIKEPYFAFMLTEEGNELSSTVLSQRLKELSLASKTIVFVIGGPFGLSEEVKNNAELLSISRMTFTHEMCRLFLLEQLYRALSIIKGRKYHKG